jgi:hypothetical protein
MLAMILRSTFFTVLAGVLHAHAFARGVPQLGCVFA